MTIERVGVVGGGLMGSGIAEVCARAGSDVVVSEVNDGLVAAARQRIERSMVKAVERGKLEDSARDEAIERIRLTTELAELADRQLVIEAATENEGLKREIFTTLDGVVADPQAILASNTSSIPITRLAAATKRPDHVIGLHFFNPVPVMPLVEVVTTVMSSPDVQAGAEDYVKTLGKEIIRSQDRAGFVVNTLLIPFMLSAIRMYEGGFASKEDIDKGMRLGLSHPMGPFELIDFVGLDTTKYIADILFDEFKDPQYASPPLLSRMVEAGLHGRKSGRGFYSYE